MLKAIFMDYYGTVVHETGPLAMGIIKQIYKDGNANSIDEVINYWWITYKERLSSSNGENFKTQHEIALENFKNLTKHFQSSQVPELLLAKMEEHWCTTPVFEDVSEFMAAITLPVCFVTNSDDRYVFENMKKHGLSSKEIITSQQARYSKPKKEIFLYALAKTGLNPDEVIHIGDSLESDVLCPNRVGIKSIWLNREGAPVPKDVVSVGNLGDALSTLHY